MRRLRFIAALAFGGQTIAFVYGGCAVDELDLNGKKCPCVSGFVCDVATNTCVSSLTDGQAPLDGEPERDAPVGGFVVSSFGPTWTTSRSIRWDWEVQGDADQFAEYQVVVGGSEDAVRRQDSTTTTFDRRINNELGRYGGRDVVPPGAPARAWTVTDRHAVARKVFARLIVRDKEGRENLSAISSADTLPEDDEVEIFNNNVADGAVTVPTDLKRVTVDCIGSGAAAACLQYGKDGGVSCPSGAKSCVIEMGVSGYDSKAASGMTEADFGKAFLEVGVRGGASAGAKPHADVILGIGNDACKIDGQPCRFRWVAGWSFRPNQKDYRLIQVPLNVLHQDVDGGRGTGQALAFKHLTSNQMRIFSITIEGEWNEGSNIGLDQLYVRW